MPPASPQELFEAGYLNKAVKFLECDAAYSKKTYKDWLVLAACKRAQGKDREAARAINMAFALNPGSLEPNYEYIQFLLSQGQIQTAISLWRQYLVLLKACPILDIQKLWDGVSDLNDKSIAVTMNYKWGLGDQIHFGRYLKLLKMKYPRVRIYLFGSQALQRLFMANGMADAFFDPAEQKSEPIRLPSQPDYTADLLLLGACLAEDYTRQEPVVYLKGGENVGPELKSYFKNQPAGRARVAFVYKGSPSVTARRHINLEELKPLFSQNPQIHFFCLQKEAEDSEFAGLDNVTNLGPRLSDFYDTAFILEKMDAVIAIETALSILAPAMGKEMHLIGRIDSSHYFHEYQGRNLWFDNFIAYRHEGEPQWGKLLERIGNALRKRFPAQERC